MAEAVCDRHAIKPNCVALFTETAVGQRNRFTFAQLKEFSNRFANALRSMGVTRGDRVAIVLPQRVETGICHIAAWKLGAISLPLSTLFGSDALRYRLENSGARIVIAAGEAFGKVNAITNMHWFSNVH